VDDVVGLGLELGLQRNGLRVRRVALRKVLPFGQRFGRFCRVSAQLKFVAIVILKIIKLNK
jgi:hypothetical protein